jgi:hypothetical protein
MAAAPFAGALLGFIPDFLDPTLKAGIKQVAKPAAKPAVKAAETTSVKAASKSVDDILAETLEQSSKGTLHSADKLYTGLSKTEARSLYKQLMGRQ